MKLVTKLNLFFALMLGISLGGAALSVWSAQQANFQIERMNLARDSYEAHLSLSNHTYQLFKQYGDALIIGDLDDGAAENELITEIRADIARIRLIIGAEIDLVGEEEIEELAALAEIEVKIEELIAALDTIVRSSSVDEFSTNWVGLSQILDSGIDRDFRGMIEAALEEESEEVTEVREQSEAQLVLYQSMAAAFSIIAIIAAFTSLWAIRQRLSRPMAQLLDGVRRFSDGDLDHRINLEGRDELAGIGTTLDMMAERVAEKTQTLASQNAELERSVAERTQQLERLLNEAKRSEINRRRMLADVSHELRTPLTIIQGEADIALRGKEKNPDIYREALVRTRDAATHTARLVDDLLFVARNDAGVARLAIEELDLRTLLRDVSQTYGQSAGQSAQMLTDLEKAPIRGDGGRLRQAILVLLDNAHHHGGNDIVIRLDQAPGGYRIAVEDNGPGMSDADKESAFQRFFRGSNAAERYDGGVGLGLPVALSIIEAHGGTIKLEDGPDGGLVASIIVPNQPKLKAVS